MAIIAVLPLLFALIIAVIRSPQAAFLAVYLPCLLLLPDYYHWNAPGLPDPTFHQAAILPIIGVWLFSGAKGWKFSLTDFFVIGFALCVAYSEYQAAGYKEAQNLMFDMLASVVLPYVAAKVFIEPANLRVPFARRFVLLTAAVVVMCLYESKMGANPFRIVLDRFFPGQGDGWVTTFRYGLARVSGPYGHAILAGVVFTAAFRLARWLEWSGVWEPAFRGLPVLPWKKARILSMVVLGGLILTLVRGPWGGAILGAGVTAIGRAKNRKLAIGGLFGALIFLGVPAGVALYQYASVGRAAAQSDSQETAAYRKELIDKYVDIALEKAAWGWGRNTWPRVEGMPSIDNYYLLLALMHGCVALAMFLGIVLVTPIRLVMADMRQPPAQPRGASFGFTLAGIFIALAFSVATVYLGTSVVPLLAVMAGWSEGYMLGGARQYFAHGAVVQAPVFRRRFARVVA